jgi:hypothetical protein
MMIGLVICIGLMAFLRYTKYGKSISGYVKFCYARAKYEMLPNWVKRNKDGRFLRTLETSNLFPWYGRKLIYVKPKEFSKLTATERDVKVAIDAKDWKQAMSIVEQLPDTPKTVRLKQVIQTKL